MRKWVINGFVLRKNLENTALGALAARRSYTRCQAELGKVASMGGPHFQHLLPASMET